MRYFLRNISKFDEILNEMGIKRSPLGELAGVNSGKMTMIYQQKLTMSEPQYQKFIENCAEYGDKMKSCFAEVVGYSGRRTLKERFNIKAEPEKNTDGKFSDRFTDIHKLTPEKKPVVNPPHISPKEELPPKEVVEMTGLKKCANGYEYRFIAKDGKYHSVFARTESECYKKVNEFNKTIIDTVSIKLNKKEAFHLCSALFKYIEQNQEEKDMSFMETVYLRLTTQVIGR